MAQLDILLLILLSALWGASYIFMRIAGPVFGPIALMSFRVLIAAAMLAMIARGIAQVPNFRGRWRQFLLIGAIGNALPFILIANAVMHLNASIAAILNATVPLFTVIVSVLWLREPLTLRTLLGAGLGIGGVSILVGWSPIPITPTVLLATGQALLAALSYGLTSVYARRTFGDITPLQAAVGQACGSAVLMVPLAIVSPPRDAITWPALLSLLALAIPCTVLAYFIYFRLIATIGPTKTSTLAFLIPLFGIFWAAVFLREPVNVGVLAGLGVILLSVWMVLTEKTKVGGRGPRRTESGNGSGGVFTKDLWESRPRTF